MTRCSLLRPATRPELFLCARCALQISSRSNRRWISQKFIAKTADAELKWQERALEIRQGKKKSMLTFLEERGLINSVTGARKEVDRMMTDQRVGAYVGIDPTAASLHVGHLLPLMSLFWMYVHGYHTITLLGGATSKIGDPTDRLTTREHIHRSIRTQYMVNMHYQLKKLWVNVEAYGLKHGYKWEWAWKRGIVNNNAWMNKLTIMEVLQILGPGVRMGPMLAKETVKNKMQKGDGMSFAEFTYPVLQSWDWWHMYNTQGIRMQIGGADQYGNITAGIDAVKYIAENHPHPDIPVKTSDPPFGFTVPLLTTSSGAKFGKSAGNAIWLDNGMTSVFDLYGYFLRTTDEDVGRYLKLFTFMKLEDIDDLVKKHMESPSQRIAQHKLASELVELVHGEGAAVDAESQHRMVFGGALRAPVAEESDLAGRNALSFDQVNVNNRPTAQMKLPRSLIETKSIGKILFAAGLAESASEGHRLAEEQSVYIGGSPTAHKMPMNDGALSFARIKLWKPEETKTYLIGGNLLILRRGKHNIRVIEVVEDEDYERSGLQYPGKNADDKANQTKENQAKSQETKVKAQDSAKPSLIETKSSVKDLKQYNPQWADVEDHFETKTQDSAKHPKKKTKRPVRKPKKQSPQWAAVEKHFGTLQIVNDGDKESKNDKFEGMDPEERLQLLRIYLKNEMAARQRKINKRNAPKPHFTHHFKRSRIYIGRNPIISGNTRYSRSSRNSSNSWYSRNSRQSKDARQARNSRG